jgi:hypothetical protein
MEIARHNRRIRRLAVGLTTGLLALALAAGVVRGEEETVYVQSNQDESQQGVYVPDYGYSYEPDVYEVHVPNIEITPCSEESC